VKSVPLCHQDGTQDCGGCAIRGEVHCGRGSVAGMRRFWAHVASYAMPGAAAVVGAAMATGSPAWPIAFTLFWVAYQGGNELLLHCPHCPYWNDDDEAYDCPVNVGVPKPRLLRRWLRYRPRPFSAAEARVQKGFNAASVLLPVAAAIHGAWAAPAPWGIVFGAIVAWQAAAGLVFARFLRTTHCSRCLHFSCVWNEQPARVARTWLEKNPALQPAWESWLAEREARERGGA
jgi:hypothetical protein